MSRDGPIESGRWTHRATFPRNARKLRRVYVGAVEALERFECRADRRRLRHVALELEQAERLAQELARGGGIAAEAHHLGDLDESLVADDTGVGPAQEPQPRRGEVQRVAGLALPGQDLSAHHPPQRLRGDVVLSGELLRHARKFERLLVATLRFDRARQLRGDGGQHVALAHRGECVEVATELAFRRSGIAGEHLDAAGVQRGRARDDAAPHLLQRDPGLRIAPAGLVEVAAHCVEARQEAGDQPTGAPIIPGLGNDLLAALDCFGDRHRPVEAGHRELRGRPAALAIVLGNARLVDRATCGLRGLAVVAAGPVRPGDQPPGHRQVLVILGLVEDRNRLLTLAQNLVRPRLRLPRLAFEL